MRFLPITLIVHAPDPITGVQRSTSDRLREVLNNAVLGEELGFDGFGIGERHERPFISSSPPVVLSHVAAITSRIRLFTAVTTLSLLDPGARLRGLRDPRSPIERSSRADHREGDAGVRGWCHVGRPTGLAGRSLGRSGRSRCRSAGW